MKKISFCILSILGILLTLSSCKKVGAVTYPTSINYGENLLNMSGPLVKGESYSVEATLGKNASLKIVITNLSDQDPDLTIPKPRWLTVYEKGWKADDYSYSALNQSYQTLFQGTSDMKIVFQGSPGKCRIDFYENSGNITNTKTYSW
jgi:hypothetical protein